MPEIIESIPPPAPDGQTFAETVKESQDAIHAASTVPPKIKRGRGRPRKTVPGAPAGSTSPGVAPGGPSVAAAPAGPDITKFIMAPLKAVSRIPAVNYRCPELALSDEEAYACAYACQQILDAFAPQGQLNPKTAAIIGACVTFGSIGFSKVQIYQDQQRKLIESVAAQTTSPDQATPEKPFGKPIDATEYFRPPQ